MAEPRLSLETCCLLDGVQLLQQFTRLQGSVVAGLGLAVLGRIVPVVRKISRIFVGWTE